MFTAACGYATRSELGSDKASYVELDLREASTTARDRPFRCGPEPCGRYAEGYAASKDKAYFEVLASLEGPPHHQGCACQPCQVKRACLRKVLTLMVRSSPGVFELVEAWALEDQAE